MDARKKLKLYIYTAQKYENFVRFSTFSHYIVLLNKEKASHTERIRKSLIFYIQILLFISEFSIIAFDSNILTSYK